MEYIGKKRLQAKGWKSGDVDEFPGLSKAETAYIKIKIALGKALAKERKHRAGQHKGNWRK